MANDSSRFYSRKKVTGYDNGAEISPSTRLILNTAEELGVTWKTLHGTKIIELSYNGQTKYFRNQISAATTDVGFYACLDKAVTSNLLEAQGIRVPRGFNLLRTDEQTYWREVFNALTKPLVVKPTYGNQGNAITMGINDWETYVTAVHNAFAYINEKEAGVIVEETAQGEEYRVLATREKVIGVVNRRPANVVGDGRSTLQELINEKNSDPRRFEDPNAPLVTIKIDDHVKGYLQEQHLNLEVIPTEGQRVFLRRNSNISTGGDSIDVTDMIHPSVAEIAVKAVNAIPCLDFVGVDFMTTDITADQYPDRYCIIEVNSSPGFSIHEFPYLGTPRRAQREFLFILFPDLKVHHGQS